MGAAAWARCAADAGPRFRAHAHPPTPPTPPPASPPVTISDDGFNATLSSTDNVTLAPSFLFAAQPGWSGSVTAYAQNVLSVRIDGVIRCFGLSLDGGVLSLVSLGGDGFMPLYPTQCAPASYAATPAATCSTPPAGGKSAYKSALLGRFTDRASSGAAGARFYAAAALALAAAFSSALA